jgi:hypothetical protein
MAKDDEQPVRLLTNEGFGRLSQDEKIEYIKKASDYLSEQIRFVEERRKMRDKHHE